MKTQVKTVQVAVWSNGQMVTVTRRTTSQPHNYEFQHSYYDAPQAVRRGRQMQDIIVQQRKV